MTKKIITVPAIAAILLTGCGADGGNGLINNPEPPATVSDALTQVSAAGEDTRFILGGGTEAEENEYSTDNISIKIFDYRSIVPAADGVRDFYEPYYFIRDSIAGSSYGIFPEENGGDFKYRVRLFDVEKNMLLTDIELPDGYMVNEIVYEADSRELCRYIISNTVYDEENDYSNTYYAVLTVHNDLSHDISYDYTPQSRSFKCCGHNIAEWEGDITDTDSGGILVEGYGGTSEYDINRTRISYDFPIDENRFVFNTLGHESLPSFGIYDFSTGTSADVPNSRDLVPIGVHGGKIYSVKTVWSGIGEEIYVTDIQTLETEFFAEQPFNAGIDDYAVYAMPESGSYIAALFTPHDTEKPEILYGIDPDTKEVVSAELPNEFEHYSLLRLEENSVMISSSSGKLLTAEINF